MMRAGAERLFPGERVAHRRFRDLVAGPMAAITSLYERFGLPIRTEARRRMEQLVAGIRAVHVGATDAADVLLRDHAGSFRYGAARRRPFWGVVARRATPRARWAWSTPR